MPGNDDLIKNIINGNCSQWNSIVRKSQEDFSLQRGEDFFK
jgi:hypothetical protein